MRGVRGTSPTVCVCCGQELTPKLRVPRGSRPGHQSICRECRRLKDREVRHRNRDRHNQKSRVYRAKVRQKVIDAYGAKCACCGEARPEFLALDHVNGGGAKQRRNGFSTSGSIYRFAIQNNFPATFRLLCHNCNLSRGFYGYCPHEKERDANH